MLPELRAVARRIRHKNGRSQREDTQYNEGANPKKVGDLCPRMPARIKKKRAPARTARSMQNSG
jgi:hypothetical protein